jgi:hypothetical protein
MQRHQWKRLRGPLIAAVIIPSVLVTVPVVGQLIDRTRAPNTANEGIAKSFTQEVGAGRGNVMTPDSSIFIIKRDPFRSVRRGRQIFQRKFARSQGQGPLTGDGANGPQGSINTELSIGAGLSDSCAGCHGRPRGSAGFGGDVATRPDSRDAPHLFGLGLKEMLGDEITTDLRAIRASALTAAQQSGTSQTRTLTSKGISYGTIIANPNGTFNTSGVQGVNADLRVRPFFHHGDTISIREFLVGAFNAEMGLEAPDTDLVTARTGVSVTTPSGMVLNGAIDAIEAPPVSSTAQDSDGDGVVNEIPLAIVDHEEFYLLHYFKAGTGESSGESADGKNQLVNLGCTTCHKPDLTINRDRRLADVETVFNPGSGNPFNRLFATASTFFSQVNDGSGHPTIKNPNLGQFVVRNIYTDFKRHDLGPNFHERNYDGTTRTQFITTPLWGVGTSAPYGHDGRSNNLMDVILRHGGEATAARNAFVAAGIGTQRNVIHFLNTLILFAPDDTASNLPGGAAVPSTPGYPQAGHGAIRLVGVFNNPNDPE